MSPEQIRSSKNVDARADVWSLGVILYELLSGTSPFWAEEVNAILAAIVADDPVPPTEARGDVPRELEAVVMKCLAKRPEARYPGVGALARALAPFGSPARRPSSACSGSRAGQSSLVARRNARSPLVAAATAGAWTHRATELAAPGSSDSFWRASRSPQSLLSPARYSSQKKGPPAGSAAVGRRPGFAPAGAHQAEHHPAAAPEPVRAEPSVRRFPSRQFSCVTPLPSAPARRARPPGQKNPRPPRSVAKPAQTR
jgi:serine/threonine-protein kinase